MPRMNVGVLVVGVLVALLLVGRPEAAAHKGDDEEGECARAQCAAETQACSGELSSEPGLWSTPLPFAGSALHGCAAGQTCCGMGLRCWRGRCAANNFGTACRSDADCFDASTAASYPAALCAYGNCRQVSLPGDRCFDALQCLGATDCLDGVCVAVPVGRACAYSAECPFNAYCDDAGVCAPSLPAGAPCRSHDQCADGGRCHAVQPDRAADKVCVAPMSQQAGQFCEAENNPFHFMCAPGLYCSLNNTCVAFTDDDDDDNDSGDSFARSCSVDDDDDNDEQCPGASQCLCNSFVGEYQCSAYYSPSTHVAERLVQLHACLVDSGCKSAERWSTGTCADVHCARQYHRAMDGMCPQLADALGRCAHLPLYSDCIFSDEDDEDALSDLGIAGLVFAVICAVVAAAAASIVAYRFYAARQAAAAAAAAQPAYAPVKFDELE